MKSMTLEVKNSDVTATLQEFLGKLLESKFVEALLVPKILPSKDGFVQTLVKDPAMLGDTNPLAPTMAVQSAQILSHLTADGIDGLVGAVLKPCELRGALELSKFLQVKIDNVVTIGIDCFGTFEVKDFAAMSEQDRTANTQAMASGTFQNTDLIREACSICEFPSPVNADITICLIGSDALKEVTVLVGDRFEKRFTEALSPELKEEAPANRESAVNDVISKRKEKRNAVLGEMKEQVNGLDKLLDTLSTCIRCHNCMNVCPICYCKECVFESRVFEHRSDQFLNWARRKGATRMPSDTLIFHLTRLGHMATSCVGCGMCDSACPNGLPVSRLFNMIGNEVQGMFEYIPGRDAGEEAPVTVFKEDELQKESGSGG